MRASTFCYFVASLPITLEPFSLSRARQRRIPPSPLPLLLAYTALPALTRQQQQHAAGGVLADRPWRPLPHTFPRALAVGAGLPFALPP